MIVPVGTIIRQIFLLVSTGADVTPWGDWPAAAAAAAMIAGIMYIIRISPLFDRGRAISRSQSRTVPFSG
jgi:hypothetical protein